MARVGALRHRRINKINKYIYIYIYMRIKMLAVDKESDSLYSS